MEEYDILENLPELIVKLTHNLSKFNAKTISTTRNLKRKSSSSLNLLHHIFSAFLVCLDKQFHDYVTDKQNKFEEGKVARHDYLMRCVRYKYKTLLDEGEWQMPDPHKKETLALRAEFNTIKAHARKGKHATSSKKGSK